MLALVYRHTQLPVKPNSLMFRIPSLLFQNDMKLRQLGIFNHNLESSVEGSQCLLLALLQWMSFLS